MLNRSTFRTAAMSRHEITGRILKHAGDLNAAAAFEDEVRCLQQKQREAELPPGMDGSHWLVEEKSNQADNK
ncbi:hypothetical protein L195_g050329 [Trifolium pratense]|uniref:Uncharacterized protein n=1 Tax=Trifolium pratense TaxID=57577 RepID=A0A2K3JTC9_TRIPR|nr:hypothetical protein L195_g050329 [Trifolium pratense]